MLAIGDCSLVVDDRLPTTAQVAGQQGAYAAHMANRGFRPRMGGMEEVRHACWVEAMCALRCWCAQVSWGELLACPTELLTWRSSGCPAPLQPPPAKAADFLLPGQQLFATMGSTTGTMDDSAEEVRASAGCLGAGKVGSGVPGARWRPWRRRHRQGQRLLPLPRAARPLTSDNPTTLCWAGHDLLQEAV